MAGKTNSRIVPKEDPNSVDPERRDLIFDVIERHRQATEVYAQACNLGCVPN
jgi:hypothetical protein